MFLLLSRHVFAWSCGFGLQAFFGEVWFGRWSSRTRSAGALPHKAVERLVHDVVGSCSCACRGCNLILGLGS